MPTITEQIAFIEDNAGRWRDVKIPPEKEGFYITVSENTGSMQLPFDKSDTYFRAGEWQSSSQWNVLQWLDPSPDLKASLIKSLSELKERKEKEAKIQQDHEAFFNNHAADFDVNHGEIVQALCKDDFDFYVNYYNEAIIDRDARIEKLGKMWGQAEQTITELKALSNTKGEDK